MNILDNILNLTYLVISILSIRYICVSISKKDNINKLLMLFIVSIWIIVSIICQIFIHIPIINFIVMLIGSCILVYSYIKNIRSTMQVVLVFSVMIVLLETMIVLIFSNINTSSGLLSLSELDLNVVYVFMSVLLIFISRIFVTIINLKNIVNNSNKDIYVLIVILLLSLCILFFMTISSMPKSTFIIISLFLLTINIFVLHMFDVISKYAIDLKNQELMSLKNDMYIKELKLFKEYNDKNQSVIHDFNKHLHVVDGYIDDTNIRAKEYISKILCSEFNIKIYSNCGTVVVDSIINDYLNRVTNNNCKLTCINELVDCKDFDDYDLTILLGNLMENAVNAVNKISFECNLHVHISSNKNALLLCISNGYSGEYEVKNNNFSNKDIIDYGLKNIINIVRIYNGEISINAQQNIFKVEIVLISES